MHDPTDGGSAPRPVPGLPPKYISQEEKRGRVPCFFSFKKYSNTMLGPGAPVAMPGEVGFGRFCVGLVLRAAGDA